MTEADDRLALLFRDEWGRLVAGLIGWCRDWDLAEEGAQEAFTAAAATWDRDGWPAHPTAWLTTVARNRIRDRIRRVGVESSKLIGLATDPTTADDPTEGSMTDIDPSGITDDRLRLVFTCCHPALPMPARVALTLRSLCGLTSAEIARAFLVTESTMDKRLVRARAKIKHAGIPYRVPPADLLPQRLNGVLTVLYLMFNEGYAASSGESLLRVDVTAEAIRLARLVHDLMPQEREVVGLLALLLLTDARRAARVRDGDVVPLAEQDRARWNQSLVEEGRQLLTAYDAGIAQAGPFEVQARIALCHDLARTAEATDWVAIAALYELLPATPVIELNRAVAVAMVKGVEAGLLIVEPLDDVLSDYYLYAATRADFEARLGRQAAATANLQRAVELAPTAAERRLLAARLAALDSGSR